MNEPYRLLYDALKKNSYPPIPLEEEIKGILLGLNPRYEETALSLPSSYCYCYANGNKWLIFRDSTLWGERVSQFWMEKINDKWQETPKKLEEKKVYTDALEESKHLFFLCMDGHPNAEKLIDVFNGHWISPAIIFKEKETSNLEIYLQEALEGKRNKEEKKAFVRPYSVYASIEDLPKDEYGDIPNIPPLNDEGIPLGLDKLPKVETSNGNRNYRGGSFNPEKVLGKVLELSQAEDFNALVEMAYVDPYRVILSYGICGVPINLPLFTKERIELETEENN